MNREPDATTAVIVKSAFSVFLPLQKPVVMLLMATGDDDEDSLTEKQTRKIFQTFFISWYALRFFLPIETELPKKYLQIKCLTNYIQVLTRFWLSTNITM